MIDYTGMQQRLQIPSNAEQPRWSIFNCCWKNSFSFIDTAAHVSQCSTGSTKHMRCRAHFDEQHLQQKQRPHRRQWCYIRHHHHHHVYLTVTNQARIPLHWLPTKQQRDSTKLSKYKYTKS